MERTEMGMEAAVQTGNTVLFVKDGGESELLDQASRLEVVTAALALEQELAAREGRDARVHVNICLHAGTVFTRTSRVIGGDLMDFGAWVPQMPLSGVVATPAMLDDLHEQAAAFIAQDPDQHRPVAVQSVLR